MNKAELNQSLDFINHPEGDLQIILYACLSNQSLKKLDINATDLQPIKQLFVNSIKSTVIDKDDYSVVPLSSTDERRNCFYHYDLELPEALSVLSRVVTNDQLEIFDFNNDSLSNIDALIIMIADNERVMTIYKKITPVEIIGRGGYMLWKSNHRLERFDKQLLRISGNFQVLRVGDDVVLLDLNIIERSFGFHDIIRREAMRGLQSIREKGIVSNLEALEELINDMRFARKLTKIARYSPVIRYNIPNADIIRFSEEHPATRRKMRYTVDHLQFTLDTQVSKDLFIKILNDDYLTSELTRIYYDSLAKDSIESETEA